MTTEEISAKELAFEEAKREYLDAAREYLYDNIDDGDEYEPLYPTDKILAVCKREGIVCVRRMTGCGEFVSTINDFSEREMTIALNYVKIRRIPSDKFKWDCLVKIHKGKYPKDEESQLAD